MLKTYKQKAKTLLNLKNRKYICHSKITKKKKKIKQTTGCRLKAKIITHYIYKKIHTES